MNIDTAVERHTDREFGLHFEGEGQHLEDWLLDQDTKNLLAHAVKNINYEYGDSEAFFSTMAEGWRTYDGAHSSVFVERAIELADQVMRQFQAMKEREE